MGFDPTSAPDDALPDYGIPARPNPQVEPDLYRFWQHMFSSKIEFVKPRFRPEEAPSELFYFQYGTKRKRRVGTSARARRAFGHLEDSRNWAGAYITPLRPNRFVHVAGAFTVPDAGIPTVMPRGAHRLGLGYRSSTWIGLGGHRPYNSLPQIGTSQYVPVGGGKPEFGAWWQWWVREREQEHGFPIEILDFPVAAGHKILASLEVQASGDVHFCLKNQDTRKFVTFLVSPPKDIVPLGATAEWVHERPMVVGRTELYPLPRTSGVEFDHGLCLAKSASRPCAAETTQKLVNPRLIRMYELFDNPHRSAFVSIPSIIEREGEKYLHIRYREAG
jgi:hypothetical protein